MSEKETEKPLTQFEILERIYLEKVRQNYMYYPQLYHPNGKKKT